MKNDISLTDLEDEKEMVRTIASAMAIKRGIQDKQVMSLFVFESEIGAFPENLAEFGKHLLRLQGFDPDYFCQQKDITMIESIHDTVNDRVFILLIAF